MHAVDSIRPITFPVPVWFVDEEGMVEKRDGGDVPGVTGKRTYVKARYVVGEVSDDEFDDFLWKPHDNR